MHIIFLWASHWSLSILLSRPDEIGNWSRKRRACGRASDLNARRRKQERKKKMKNNTWIIFSNRFAHHPRPGQKKNHNHFQGCVRDVVGCIASPSSSPSPSSITFFFWARECVKQSADIDRAGLPLPGASRLQQSAVTILLWLLSLSFLKMFSSSFSVGILDFWKAGQRGERESHTNRLILFTRKWEKKTPARRIVNEWKRRPMSTLFNSLQAQTSSSHC